MVRARAKASLLPVILLGMQALIASSTITLLLPPAAGAVAIHVTTTGSPSGAGTQSDPVNLKTGIARLAAGDSLRIAYGIYAWNDSTDGPFRILDNTDIEGGFNPLPTGWVKNVSQANTDIQMTPLRSTAGHLVWYDGVRMYGNQGFKLADLTFDVYPSGPAGTSDGLGNSVYGLRLQFCRDFRFSRLIINTGNAGDGSAGSAGANGASGAAGAAGGPGSSGDGSACRKGRKWGCSGRGRHHAASVFVRELLELRPGKPRCGRDAVRSRAVAGARAGPAAHPPGSMVLREETGEPMASGWWEEIPGPVAGVPQRAALSRGARAALSARPGWRASAGFPGTGRRSTRASVPASSRRYSLIRARQAQAEVAVVAGVEAADRTAPSVRAALDRVGVEAGAAARGARAAGARAAGVRPTQSTDLFADRASWNAAS